MIIVGVSRVHNAAVALLQDGELIFHLENERLSNIKYDAYTFNTLSELPKYVDKVDKICIAGVGKTVPVESFTDHNVFTVFIARLTKKFFETDITTYDLWDQHHKLHAACAFYNSGFTKAVCIIKDGSGSEYYIDDPRFYKNSYGREISSTYTASYPANFNLISKQVAVPFNANVVVDNNVVVSNHISEAHAFQLVSELFGFHSLDAGKVMGMASYGVFDKNIPAIYDENFNVNNNLFCIKDDIRLSYINIEKYPYLNTDDFQIRANFAYALQTATQQKIKKEILDTVEKTGCKNVCLSGGFFLNCVANYEFLKDLPNDISVYVEPISSDAGTSIGAAKLMWHETSQDMTVRPQKTLYHGLHHNLSLDEIKSKLKTEKITHVSYYDVAQLIANKNIIALYQGRSEAGPRALGNRSILYDPRDVNGKEHVNTVKNREWFRPFAGSVLQDECHNWFDMRGLHESPFMMFAVNVLPEKQSSIPAITHVDGTCRIQTVDKNQNYHYYNLISEFNNITGVPILFNTSFNLAGDCIVETIDQALDTIRRSNINYLYLPEFNCLISKD
jgi:carbamoyltransferase